MVFSDSIALVAETPYLAGAVVPLLDRLSTLHRIGCSLDEAIRLTSVLPGQLAGRGGRRVR